MPNNKLTDTEIIKAMEHKVKIFCETCKHKNCDSCVCNVAKQGLDLTNRLKAKNERLRDNLNAVLDEAKEFEAEYEKVYEQAYNDARTNLVDGGASCRLCMAATEFKVRKEFAKQLEAEIISSDKYIREYDDSEVQKAYNKGLRDALKILKEMG